MLNKSEIKHPKSAIGYSLDPQTARLILGFNADEAHWRRIADLRALVRTLFQELSEKEIRELECRVFERTRPPEDCIGLPG